MGRSVETEKAAHLPRLLLVVAVIVLSACSFRGEDPEPVESAAPPTLLGERADTLWQRAKPVLNNRCVACHGCYDAPCQLKLSSPEGIRRGASRTGIYNAARLRDAPMTRLHIDAATEAEWRKMGFTPVVPASAADDPAQSVMAQLLTLGRDNAPAPDSPLPDDVTIGVFRSSVCPTPETYDRYARRHAHGGMPYAMAALPDAEYDVLMAWLDAGAPMPSGQPRLPEAALTEIATWESWLNETFLRRRLVARYLYEHLFLAHLMLDSTGTDQFFRIIRSSTPPGEAPEEIASRRPFDDPGRSFYYRIVPVRDTILYKEHNPYAFGAERLDRFEELFVAPDYRVLSLPGYGAGEGANPFVVFADLPARSRYQFLLDDSTYFVRSFIRGPVCHGDVATNVIEDRFWVSFLDPDADLSITDPAFLKGGASLIRLPAELSESNQFQSARFIMADNESAWIRYRDEAYAASPAHGRGFSRAAIWDGDGDKAGARLTVFRNTDNAAVIEGFWGTVPETAWVIDFPLFERVYYDLVAGFDVFGRVDHQLATRFYMDNLRREGEDLFLAFLPPDERRVQYAQWYRGPLTTFHARWAAKRERDSFPTAVTYATANPKAEFLLGLIPQEAAPWPRVDAVNRCEADSCEQDPLVAELSRAAGKEGSFVSFLPDVSILRVDRENRRSRVFTIIKDVSHLNVAMLFAEQLRREPEKDVLTIIEGHVGSYPNFAFEVSEDDLDRFVDDLVTMEAETDWYSIVDSYGVRRTSPRFWAVMDLLNTDLAARDPVGAGLLDLNRYIDPGHL